MMDEEWNQVKQGQEIELKHINPDVDKEN